MAARNRKGLSENTRQRIKTTMIVKRLTSHILGEVEMTSSQVTAALGLIKKTLPDLQAMEMKAEVEHKQRVISAKPISETEWADQYGSGMEPTARPPESLN